VRDVPHLHNGDTRATRVPPDLLVILQKLTIRLKLHLVRIVVDLLHNTLYKKLYDKSTRNLKSTANPENVVLL